MLNFSMAELGIILVIALMVFGPGKLPEASKALGKGIGEFRQAISGETAKAAINSEGKSAESKPDVK